MTINEIKEIHYHWQHFDTERQLSVFVAVYNTNIAGVSFWLKFIRFKRQQRCLLFAWKA